MPIPAPKSNELQRDFVSRCYTEIKDEYDRPVAFGICYSKWREKQMSVIRKLKKKG